MAGGAVPFADAFLKWKAGNRASATYVTCRIPAENAERLREVILSLGGEEIVGRKKPE